MPEHASRFAAALYDQFEDEHRVADWGGDDLFNRMPRPRAVDDAPAPRFRPQLAAVEPREAASDSTARTSTSAARASASAARASRSLALVAPPEDRGHATAEERSSRERRRAARTAEQAMLDRAERLGLSLVEPAHEPVHRWDEAGSMIEPEPAGRRTKVITGHPGGTPRPLPTVRAERRRPPRTPAEWIGPRPERIVGWAFALGLLLILIAISTADAATL
jgi:hypothetical protein